MLLSMTGYGEARCDLPGGAAIVEIRTLNNRYLKFNFKYPEPYAALETQLEQLLRRHIRRGTVQVVLRIDRQHPTSAYRLNQTALVSYYRQLEAAARELGLHAKPDLAALALVPGVVLEECESGDVAQQDWPAIAQAAEDAAAALQEMRRREGRSMADELSRLCGEIGSALDHIAARAPSVVAAYQQRLRERVDALLAGSDVTLAQDDLVKEVSLFAERSDIAEEIVRLRSHLDQFAETLDEPESAGRKLEFVTQEMFREINTIGSKAPDVEIARSVVEVKGAVERIRELLQNIE